MIDLIVNSLFVIFIKQLKTHLFYTVKLPQVLLSSIDNSIYQAFLTTAVLQICMVSKNKNDNDNMVYT